MSLNLEVYARVCVGSKCVHVCSCMSGVYLCTCVLVYVWGLGVYMCVRVCVGSRCVHVCLCICGVYLCTCVSRARAKNWSNSTTRQAYVLLHSYSQTPVELEPKFGQILQQSLQFLPLSLVILDVRLFFSFFPLF